MSTLSFDCLDKLFSNNLSQEAREEALTSCRSRFSVITKCPNFYNIQSSDFKEIIKHNRLNCESEDQIVDVLNLWLNIDSAQRCVEFEELLYHVRLSFIDPDKLQSLLENKIIARSLRASELINNAIQFNNLSDGERQKIITLSAQDPRYQRRIPVENLYVLGNDRYASKGKLWRLCPYTRRVIFVCRTSGIFHLTLVHKDSIYLFSPHGSIARYDISFDSWHIDHFFMEDCGNMPIHDVISLGDFIYTFTCASKVGCTFVMRKYDTTTKSSTSWHRKFHELGQDPVFISHHGLIYIFNLESIESRITGIRYNPQDDTMSKIETFTVPSHNKKPIFFAVGEHIYVLRDSAHRQQSLLERSFSHEYRIDQYDPIANKWTESVKVLNMEVGEDILQGQGNRATVNNSEVYFFGKSCNFYLWKPCRSEEFLALKNPSTSDPRYLYTIV